MESSIREVRGAASEQLIALLNAAEEGEDRVRAALADSANTAYGMWSTDGGLVGAAVARWEAEASEIIYIAVAEALRGQGYGKRLIAWLLAEGLRRGVSAVLVGTSTTSLENIAFYQQCGFRMDHMRRDYFAYIQPPISEHGMPLRDMIVFKYDIA